jgi:phage terminase large subunit-like protein
MAVKRIIVRSSQGNKYFKWWDTDKEIREDSDGTVGKAATLEDAVAIAKSHTGGAIKTVEVSNI